MEILGYIHVAAANEMPTIDDTQAVEIFDAVRPDGSTRSFAGPRVTFHQDQLCDTVADDSGGRDE